MNHYLSAMEHEYLHTARIMLRKVSRDVYSYLFDHCSRQEQMDFFQLYDPVSLQQEEDKHRGGMGTYRSTFLQFHLLEKESGRLLGACGFHNWYPDHFRAELGYALRQEEDKGKGYMKEILPTVVQYGFREMNLNRIEAFVGPENIPSLKLVEGLGFAQEGTLREHFYKNGKVEDSIVFGLLRRQYLSDNEV